MAQIEASIDLEVPRRTAYREWVRFEEFPRFMPGVEEVRRLDARRLYWRASVGGRVKEWVAEIAEQRPDRRIGWRSRTGAANAGVVTFHPLLGQRTRMRLRLDYEPEGLVETLAEAVGLVSRRVTADLRRFKAFVETRPREAGPRGGILADRRAA